MSKYLWVIRHGENLREAEEDGRLRLSPTGELQMQELARLLGQSRHFIAPVLIVYARMMRSLQSASILQSHFNNQSLSCSTAHCNELVSTDIEEIGKLMSYIQSVDFVCPEEDIPSVIMITHRRNELMKAFSCIIDPAHFMGGTKSVTTEDVLQADTMTDDEIDNLFGSQNTGLPVSPFASALGFRLDIERWEDFGFNCGQFVEEINPALA